jgi:hypothetical protein
MKTYKLGNKIKCIIRSFSTGKIGDQEMIFGNQPYTVLKDVEASLSFSDNTHNSKTSFVELAHNKDSLQEITFSNVELNDKILNLIFSKNEDKPCSTMENVITTYQQFQISTDVEKIYQVFVYNCEGELLAATGEVNLPNGSSEYINFKTFDYYNPKNHTGLEEDILVFYTYEGNKSFKLNHENTQYLTLDLILEGNRDDELNHSYLHINKCELKINKNMYFNRSLNAVDLKFTVINDNESYITLE